ncbi:M13 family metallopeptidase [Citromicrobium sp. WPS32]|uniref:M13 family metallopeptidase n=1 Tax=Citromicrobium sp. WPS32 TaxID=1634517 RepID=UPI0006C91293|nr:M13 family metallopeptidase [Citromicrobium sp. WPS32]KPM13729.1 peptidase M13 [Citromicrobium sp. WPS32]|tara:strand:- start:10086 stop:12167 length:2082 start_codon:yes stop_codon:yes gene_type:complete
MKTRLIAALMLGTAVATLGPVACQNIDGSEVATTPGTELGIRTDWMDTSASPGDDFFRYADGKWYDETEIPADRSSVGGFYIADQQTEKNLAALIKDIVSSDPEPGSDAAKVKTFYEAYLDTKAIDAAGMKPIQNDLKRFEGISDKQQLAKVLGSQVRADVDPLNATDFETENLFGVFVTQALKGGEVVPYILQGGLGMPEREYYLSSDAKMSGLRSDYQAYIAQLLSEANVADAEAKAKRIYDLEMKIAKAHVSREDSDDWATASSLWSQDDFKAKAPGMDWDAFFRAAQLGGFETFDAYHPSAITGLSKLVESEPLEAWKDWLVFHQINANTAVLPTRLDQLSFDFYGKKLYGTQEQRPRDKRALAAVNAYMGDALGKLYVEKYFPASAKAEIQGMVDNIKDAFADRIEAVEWMAPETKAEAKKKVETMAVGVGYPDEWTNYGTLNIADGNAYADVQAAEKLRYRQQLAKVGKPLDKREWWMNAQLVNAVNLPVQNALNFPAAILQPPFFDPKADPAYNYGAIGAVIGHEISHSFDNNGAAFDSTGAMRDWWTDADRKKFEEAGKALAAQYDTYEPFPGLHVKGELTLGENIADIAGLQAAYDAYHASLGGKEAPVIDGFTGDQRFFIAYAQTWATKMREAALRQRIATDGHAPGQYRALTVRNMDAWYKAFDVKEGDKLYLPPEKRVKVW